MKRAPEAKRPRLEPSLPQLSSCGPIEALANAYAAIALRSFRNYQVAAPLKQEVLRATSIKQDILPQLSSCGPIEAAPVLQHRSPYQAFRNYQVAAPLKLGQGSARSSDTQTFRNYQVAAPLKHVFSFGFGCQYGLPQLSSCGPIEAAGPAKSGWCPTAPSATIKLRPH